MTYEIEPYNALCALKTFIINGIRADEGDFGYGEDACPWEVEPYSCGNRVFVIEEGKKPITCKKYGITESEFDEIAEKLEDKLSFGKCGWCV